MELDPTITEAYYNRGIAYGILGQVERAIEHPNSLQDSPVGHLVSRKDHLPAASALSTKILNLTNPTFHSLTCHSLYAQLQVK
ncbi:tetratricopeptide repeat protein, partial [Chloroflexota bacterium]